MPQLDPTWFASQLFWLVLCFSLLYFVLSRTVLPRLQGAMAQRSFSIDSDLAMAQEFKAHAEEAKGAYERVLAESKFSAQAILAEAEAQSKERAEHSNKALDKQVATQLANASRSVSEKKQEILSALKPKLGEFSALITEKITTKSPDEELVLRVVQKLN